VGRDLSPPEDQRAKLLLPIQEHQNEGVIASNGRNSHAFRHAVIISLIRDAKIDPAVVATIADNTPRTIYSNYSSQVSIDEQRRMENVFDRVKRKE